MRLLAREDSRLLLVAGKPLQEPIVQHGPFVMNDEQEIYQAISDYRQGRLGVCVAGAPVSAVCCKGEWGAVLPASDDSAQCCAPAAGLRPEIRFQQKAAGINGGHEIGFQR